jgi:hypothetical protein
MADEAGTPHPHAGAVVGNDVVTVGEQRTGFEKKKGALEGAFSRLAGRQPVRLVAGACYLSKQFHWTDQE